MSAGSVSLEAAIRTCKVDTAWANKVESDRFFNPNLMVCPVWNGVDVAGRQVCPDSFWTKRAGCNSAEDRVMVENNVSRPQYMEYINLNAEGIAANIYGTNTHQQEYEFVSPFRNMGKTNAAINTAHNMTGQFGQVTGFNQNVIANCGGKHTAYQQAMAQEAEQNRLAGAMNPGFKSAQLQAHAGF